jgi:hypothetical protein
MLLMRSPFLFTLGAAVLIPSAFAADCDRACLKGVLDQYLNAVIQHSPSGVSLTPGYRQTENAVVRRPGQGIWQTAKALGKVQRRYFDAVTQNTGYFGTLEETSGNTAVVTVRLKVADRKVAEAEWYLARKGDASASEPARRPTALSGIPITWPRTRPPSVWCPKPNAFRART